jgi:hypothetical protein
MYTAMVLACFASQPCIEFTDVRGPYYTEQECRIRVDEMVQGIVKTFPYPITSVQYKCKTDKNKIGT